MLAERPFALSIAGFDPSGGAGVLADVKTFEQHRVYGLSVLTANTIQTAHTFQQIEWVDSSFVKKSLECLLKQYTVSAVKIGITASLADLKEIITVIKQYAPAAPVVWDTVLKSSTAFEFIHIDNKNLLPEILSAIDLITPNYNELLKLSLSPGKKSAEAIAEELTQHCNVLLKGGHHPSKAGTDYLFTKDGVITFPPHSKKISAKHGSGCVLSAAIAANIASGKNLEMACKDAKTYIEKILSSNPTLLGFHVQ